MPGHGSKFSRKKEAAIAALLTHRNVEDAARAIDVGASTLLRWLKLPEFDAEYRRARRQAVSQATARLQQASGAATSVLLNVMADTRTPPAVRARAAHTVLEMGMRAVELEDFEARLVELERIASAEPQ
jgi:transposase-like protein